MDINFNESHEKWKSNTQYRVSNILNLEKAQYRGIGPYDIPQLEPVSVEAIGVIKEWIPFNMVMSDKDPKEKGVHFFIDDYQFLRIWNAPDKYIEKLKQYKAVLTLDFSTYGDMPMATQNI